MITYTHTSIVVAHVYMYLSKKQEEETVQKISQTSICPYHDEEEKNSSTQQFCSFRRMKKKKKEYLL